MPRTSSTTVALSSARAPIRAIAGRRAIRREASGSTTPLTTRNTNKATPRIGSKAPSEQAGERRHERGDHRRDDDAGVEVLERVDVGHDPRQQVAAAVSGQAGRGERLDGGEEPDPQVGQDREGRAMGHVPLEVAERGPRRWPARGRR